MVRKGLSIALSLAWLSPALAQDQRDEEIFGAEAQPSQEQTPQATQAKEDRQEEALKDSMQIGGRLEIRNFQSQREQENLQKGSFQSDRMAEIYFDTRPNKSVRGFLKTRIYEDESPKTAGASSLRYDIDELWMKWDLDQKVFLTAGKQKLKWGSGRLWNPTDFTAKVALNPFDSYDRRFGQDMLKVHLPFEKQGHNFYLIVQPEDAQRNDEVAAALRAEFALFGSSELSFSAHSRRGQARKLGIDLSSALGPIDIKWENAWSEGHQNTFYRDSLVSSDQILALPVAYQDSDKKFLQSLFGLSYTWKYSSDDNLTVAAEYFWNELGYDNRFDGLYSYLLGDSPGLYVAKRYVGGSFLLPAPGSWNKTSFSMNGIQNLSDKTAVLRASLSQEWLDYLNFDVFVSRCFGEYGELCLRLPESIKTAVAASPLPDQVKDLVRVLPTKKTLWTSGFGLTLRF